jgi:hypothetical protein
MGAEAICTARFRGAVVTGKARLETDVLQFRGGEVRLSIPFKSMSKIAARGGTLSITGPEGAVSFELGTAAPKWAAKIQHPASRLDKLGAKPDWRASALGIGDQDFLKELERAVAQLSVGRMLKSSDAIFFGATREADLARLEALTRSLKPNGALWVVRPKGRPEISERAVMAAGKAAGLVDVKVVSFSPTHTAEKFVIPVAKRSRKLRVIDP